MLNFKKSNKYASNFLTILLIGIALLISSCSKKVRFNVSNVVPAAEGTVKISKDQNENLMFSMNVKNLAEPKRLTPPKATYVLWMQTKNDGVKNLGQVKTSSGYFSSTRTATLKAISQYEPVRFFITAEDKPSVEYPGSFTVLTTKNF